jgi:phage shock protein A
VTALDALACKAITLDDDDLAREAIARRLVIEDGSASLNAQDAQLALEHDGFIDAARALEHKVQILSVEKEAVKAKYTATGSRTEIDGIVSALQSEVVNVELAVRRAGERVAQLRARARMLDDLLASGVLPDLSRPPGVLGAEVHRVLGSERVTAELATMKKTRGV